MFLRRLVVLLACAMTPACVATHARLSASGAQMPDVYVGSYLLEGSGAFGRDGTVPSPELQLTGQRRVSFAVRLENGSEKPTRAMAFILVGDSVGHTVATLPLRSHKPLMPGSHVLLRGDMLLTWRSDYVIVAVAEVGDAERSWSEESCLSVNRSYDAESVNEWCHRFLLGGDWREPGRTVQVREEQPRTAALPSPEIDDPEIYRVVEAVVDRGPHVVPHPTLLASETERDELCGTLVEGVVQIDPEWRDAARDYLLRAKGRFRLRARHFERLGIRLFLVPTVNLAATTKASATWRFSYRGADSYQVVSSVGVSRDHTRALIRTQRISGGPLGYESFLMFLKKAAGRWQLQATPLAFACGAIS